jgi:long-chain acyl-CoA synthetase
MARRVDLFVGQMGLAASDSTLVAADVGRPVSLLGQLLPMLRVGGRAALLPRPDPAIFWEAYAAARPTYVVTTPGLAFNLLDHPAAATDHSALRFWVTGGDRAPQELHRRASEVVGKPLLEMCGMTETGFYAINPWAGPVKPGSIGLAMRGVAVRLVAPDGGDVPPGEVGRVVVRTPDLMAGYWNDTLTTHRVLQDGWLDTGDLARADADGYLWFVGRDRDMIVRDGAKVAPVMVEEALLAHPAVSGAAVVGVSHPRSGQVPFAFYRLRPGQPDPGPEGLRAWVAARVESPSVPAGFVALERWPVTDQGKLDRPRLAWMAEAGVPEL